MRRGMVGTSPQHRTKSSIRRDVHRISDDRALKVAGAYPGRPVASRKLALLKFNRTIRENRWTKTQAPVGHRVLTTGEPASARSREHKDRHATAERPPSERTVMRAHRVTGVSSGHSKPEETSRGEIDAEASPWSRPKRCRLPNGRGR